MPPLSGSSAPPRVVLEIALKKVQQNALALQKKVYPAKLLGVLKSDAYGLGTLPIAKALVEVGVNQFGVATPCEAEALRACFKGDLHLLGACFEEEIPKLLQLGVILPLQELRLARRVSKIAAVKKQVAKVQLLIDTGMGRLGIPYFRLAPFLKKIASLPQLICCGSYSHFSSAFEKEKGSEGEAHTKKQLKRFQAALTVLEQQRKQTPMFFRTPFFKHLANSDGINNYPNSYFNLVRSGINLYGVFDLKSLRSVTLKPTLTLKSRLIAKRFLPKGFPIGYGLTYRLPQAMWIGTIPIGYADGVPFCLGEKMASQALPEKKTLPGVLLRGRRFPIVGRVSMDYITVALKAAPEVRVGEEAILIGKSGREEILVEEWARFKKTHPYEIITALGKRVQRVYR